MPKNRFAIGPPHVFSTKIGETRARDQRNEEPTMQAPRLRSVVTDRPLSFVLSLFATTLLLLLPTPSATAQVPATLSYQGQITTTADGRPVPNGSYHFSIALYDSEQGGTPLWREDHRALLYRGVFSLQLGSIVPLDLPFDRPYFLGVSFQGDPEMEPRTPLSTSPYAFRAEVAGSLDGGAVTGINGQQGEIEIVGQGATIVSNRDGVITIASTLPKELLGGKKVEISPKKAQKSGKGNSMIHLDETSKKKSPNLIEMEVDGKDKFVVDNDGDVTAGDVTAGDIKADDVAAKGIAGTSLAIRGATKLGDGVGSDGLTVSPGTGAISFSDARLRNVGTPVASDDAATRGYVDRSIAAGDISGEPIVTFARSAGLTNNRVLVSGTGVSISNPGTDDAPLTVGIGQDVAPTASPFFAAMTIGGDLEVAQNLFVSGLSELDGNTSIGGDLSVLGNSSVAGSSSVAGNSSVTGNSAVAGNATVDGTLLVSQPVTAASSLFVGTSLTVGDDATITDQLYVAGDVAIDGMTDLRADARVFGDLDVDTDLNVDGNSVVVGSGSVGTTMSVGNDLSVGANATITDDLFVLGDVSISGETDMLDDARVDGDFEVQDDLEVGGDADISGATEIGGELEVASDLTVSGDSRLSAVEVENASGIALEIADGGLQLSTATYTADATTPPTIGAADVAAIVNATTAGAGDDINVPATGSLGQLIVVLNSSGATVDLLGTAAGAVAIPDGEGVSILYDGTSWVVVR